MPSANTNTAGSGAARPTNRQGPVMPATPTANIAVLNAQFAQRKARAQPAATPSHGAIHGSPSPTSSPSSSVTSTPATVAPQPAGWKQTLWNSVPGAVCSSVVGVGLVFGLKHLVNGLFKVVDVGVAVAKKVGLEPSSLGESVYNLLYKLLDVIPSGPLEGALICLVIWGVFKGAPLILDAAKRLLTKNRPSKAPTAGEKPEDMKSYFQRISDETMAKTFRNALLGPPKINLDEWMKRIGIHDLVTVGDRGVKAAIDDMEKSGLWVNREYSQGGLWSKCVNLARRVRGICEPHELNICRMVMAGSWIATLGVIAIPAVPLITGAAASSFTGWALVVLTYVVASTLNYGVQTVCRWYHDNSIDRKVQKFIGAGNRDKGELKSAEGAHQALAYIGAAISYFERYRPWLFWFPKSTKGGLWPFGADFNRNEIRKQYTEAAILAANILTDRQASSGTPSQMERQAGLGRVEEVVNKNDELIANLVQRWKFIPRAFQTAALNTAVVPRVILIWLTR